MCNNNVKITSRLTNNQHLAFERTDEQLVYICIDEMNAIGVAFPRDMRAGQKVTLMNNERIKLVLECHGRNSYLFRYTPENSCVLASPIFKLAEVDKPLRERVYFERTAEEVALDCMDRIFKLGKTFPHDMKPGEKKIIADTEEFRINIERTPEGKFKFTRRIWRLDGTAIPEVSSAFVLV